MEKIGTLADKLLEPAVQHTEVFKRASYGVTPERLPDFHAQVMSSGFSDLLRGHLDPDTRAYYSYGVPDSATIMINHFDHNMHKGVQSGYKQTEVEINMRYRSEDREFNDLRLILPTDHPRASGFVYSSEYSETGYEGHSWKSKSMGVRDLKDFYDVVENFATLPLIEKSFSEQMAEIKLVNEQTGQELFYSPEVDDWRPRNDEEMQIGNEVELNKDNPRKDRFTIIRSYKIEKIEE